MARQVSGLQTNPSAVDFGKLCFSFANGNCSGINRIYLEEGIERNLSRVESVVRVLMYRHQTKLLLPSVNMTSFQILHINIYLSFQLKQKALNSPIKWLLRRSNNASTHEVRAPLSSSYSPWHHVLAADAALNARSDASERGRGWDQRASGRGWRVRVERLLRADSREGCTHSDNCCFGVKIKFRCNRFLCKVFAVEELKQSPSRIRFFLLKSTILKIFYQ